MKKILWVLLFIIIGITVLPAPLFAQYAAHSDKTVTLNKSQTVNGDYFAAGSTVTISGTINGDAYIAGGKILIDGTINGDLLVAGGTVNIRGTVRNDIRAAGGTITISGKVGGNTTTVGGTINISDSAQITGSLVAAGGTIDIFAPLGRGATIGGGNVTIANVVGGDILAGVGKLQLTSDAKVNGNITYYSRDAANVSQDATISGKVTHNLPPQKNIDKKKISEGFSALSTAFKIVSFFTSLIIGGLFILFFPIFTHRVAQTIAARPGMSILVGFLSMIALPFLFILLLLTIVGIPFALTILFAYFLLAYLSKIFVSLFIGQQLFLRTGYKTKSVFWTFAAGLVVYSLLTMIPFLGWFIGLIGFFAGFGALLLEKKYYYITLRDKKLI
jgi:cytoskeletal protein CcmA (bactofilin family)